MVAILVNLSRKGVGKPTRGPKNAKSEKHTPHTRKTKRSRIWLGLGLGLGFFWKIRHFKVQYNDHTELPSELVRDA